MMWFSWMMPFKWLPFSFSSWVLPPAEPNRTLEEVFDVTAEKSPQASATQATPTQRKAAIASITARCSNLSNEKSKLKHGQGVGLTLDPAEQAGFDSFKDFMKAFTTLCDDNGLRIVAALDYSATLADPKKTGDIWSVMFKLAAVRATPKVD